MEIAKLKGIEALKLRQSVFEYFEEIEDPRVSGRCEHRLIDIIAISSCAILCGVESFAEMEEFGEQKKAWLEGFLELPSGIPSHDTFARVLSLLNAEALEMAFMEWAKELRCEAGRIKRISIDGKSVRGTDRSFNTGTRPLHLINVLCHETGLVLGQRRAIGSGTAEVKSAVECLDLLEIEKTLVSVDAGIACKAFIDKILEKKGYYLFPVKGAARLGYQELVKLFSNPNTKVDDRARVSESSHGRLEGRKVRVVHPESMSAEFNDRYPGAETIIEIHRVRKQKDKRFSIKYKVNPAHQSQTKTDEETVYYVSNKHMSAIEALEEIRDHWAIENKLHWSLDVLFSEDDCRVRQKTAARNLALLRKIAFNIIQKCPEKGSKKIKMKRASWNHQYLEKLLGLQ